MSLFKDVAIRQTIEDFCKARDRAIELHEQGCRLIDQAEEVCSGSLRHSWPYEAKPRTRDAQFVKELDQRMWRSCFQHTGLARLMDDQATKEFEVSIERECPAFTIDNIQSMALSMWQDKDEMFLRGVYNVFRKLDDSYWSNKRQAFEVKLRSVATFVIDTWTADWSGKLRVRHEKRAWVNDLDRVCCLLSGRDYVEYSLETAMNAHFETGDNTFENDWIKARGFKNGNMHIWITDEDLRVKINKAIAEYCGLAIPEDKVA